MGVIAGYVTSDVLPSGFFSHQVQNFATRRFVEAQGHAYSLSWTEFKSRAPMMLASLLEEDFYEGICFYSVEQLSTISDAFEWIAKIRGRGLWLGFAREALTVTDAESVEKIRSLVWLKKNVEGPRPDLRGLWDSSGIS